MEQFCRVMKAVIVQKNNIVFDFDSRGDLFYMVLDGEVDCKIKMAKQLIHLSDEEKQMFCKEFQADILQISPLTKLNEKIENIQIKTDSAKGSKKQGYDIKTQLAFKLEN